MIAPAKRPRAKPIDREGPVLRSIVGWLRAVLPDAIVFHVPNESRRPGRAGMIERQNALANGVLPGVWDVIALTAQGPVLLEVKAGKGRVSEAQEALHGRAGALGYRTTVVRSIDDTRAALAAWGVETRERVA